MELPAVSEMITLHDFALELEVADEAVALPVGIILQVDVVPDLS